MKELHMCVCAWVCAWVWKGCGRGGKEVVVMEGQNQNAIKATQYNTIEQINTAKTTHTHRHTQHNKSTHTTHETTYDTT